MIHYKEGFKYALTEDTAPVQTGILPDKDIRHGFIFLGIDGLMVLLTGFAWDGPSGPTYDSPDSLRGSAFHDGLYGLMGEKLISIEHKDRADDLLRRLCIEDGMPHWRAELWHEAVKKLGAGHITPQIVLTAP